MKVEFKKNFIFLTVRRVRKHIYGKTVKLLILFNLTYVVGGQKHIWTKKIH